MNALLLVLVLASARGGPKATLLDPPLPVFEPAGFVAQVDNPYFPLRPGTIRVYEDRSGKKPVVDTVTVTRETKVILGVNAVVVRDVAWRDSALIEETADWYAQDRKGNVWYLGEDTKELRAGKVASTAGSWEAGRSGAQPGIVMWAHPAAGGTYRQEYRKGVAEDMARVLGTDASVTAGGVAYTQCVQTEEWSPLEPGVREHKFYARGVGLVRMVSAAGAHEEQTLVRVFSR